MSESFLIKPDFDKNYQQITHGRGVFLYDQNGKSYLDASSGAVTTSLGHGVSTIRRAMLEQAKKVSFVYRSQFTTEPAEKLATKLNEKINLDVDYYTFFVNSGSEATETALKIAIQYWQDQKRPSKTFILSRWFSYHGITLGALSMSGHIKRRERFAPLLEKYPQIEAPYCYRCPYQMSYPTCQLKCATELETAINRIGAEQIAAFIAEPIVGAAGAAITPPKGYYEKISEICQKNDILFIADEVMTGAGRTGTFLACEHWRVQPDIITLGKGLAAGYATIAAASIHEKIYKTIRSNSKLIMSGHTHSANPFACATALAVLQYNEDANLTEKVKKKGIYLKKQLKYLAERYKMIGDIRGLGLLIGVELVQSKRKKEMFPRKMKVVEKLIEIAEHEGLLLYPASAGDGVQGDAFLIAPPYTITYAEMHVLLAKLQSSFTRLEEELKEV
ncbi:hypothetical protein AJ85_21500 [Alkalihalobacillus alcalophilus ATCC 27647 = CGMCC 1.3604]|uniref:Aspartate aminotransferase family protein n=1 Tax=Alkalihalobacillus alcalophilus ATCC 27647 = CGMCC 1.3604 TaxID=1218173 RepID=A0A4V3X839_ALKAL|nr:aspartate aminotransferase family protein [Alkalihalobacillus alcalophilus]MED1562039.1 aspartate aminotransferase family protein [Alkalihalobacillus alcalophilus]THG88782.1 hypothetical protein AJ85_21500 [Alkalihalobacillus alcalophilus ATCC 27647 = CGMCC 1.3604]